MTPTTRTSLNTDLASRYDKQRVGSAFDIKKILSTKTGQIINATSMQSAGFQSPSGFVVGNNDGVTQFKDAQSTTSKGLSTYVKGFNSQKYKP